MRRIDHWFRLVENALATIAGISLLVMVAVMVGDAVGRYALHSGLQGTYRLVELFLFPALLFFAWPMAQRAGRNVAVDLFRSRASGTVRRILDAAVAVVVLGFVLLVVLGAYQGLLGDWGKWTVETPSLPIGPSKLLLLVGTVALAVRLVLQIIATFAGRDVALGTAHAGGKPRPSSEAEVSANVDGQCDDAQPGGEK